MAKAKHWLLKTEPTSYSIDDLKRDRRTSWDGVRNYQARNFMRDEMRVGDRVLIYHSSADPPGVAGIARVCREAYADDTALDPDDSHYDAKATPHNPIWMMVDVEFVEKFPAVVSLSTLKATPKLEGMLVTKRGQRLSVQPVDARHFDLVCKLARHETG